MRVMFRFPDCFLSQITYFQPVRKGGEEGVGFFSKHTVYVLPGVPGEQARLQMFLLLRAVFLSLLCTLDAPAPGKRGQEAGGCKSHLSVLCTYTSVGDRALPRHVLMLLPSLVQRWQDSSVREKSAGTRHRALPWLLRLRLWEAASEAAHGLPRRGCCSVSHRAFRAGAGR